jgi:DNA-binding transcriptional LysR family regulator
MACMSEVDLNLLRVFDTLFELRSVTRAAARLNLTQSAVSHALARLRHALDDQLFVRSAQGLQPTARATEIAPGLRDGLDRVRHALAPGAFEPASARRTFAVSAGTYLCTILMPPLLSTIRGIAPHVAIRLRPPSLSIDEELDAGQTDLALGVFRALPPRFAAQTLYHERLVWIAAAGHPLGRGPVDPVDLAAQPRLILSAGRPFEVAAPAPVDAPEPIAFGYDALSASAIVGATDLIARVPRRFALRNAERDGVIILDTEGGGADVVALQMIWHRKSDGDRGLSWLREHILETVAAQDGAAQQDASLCNSHVAAGPGGVSLRQMPEKG